jgi:hypothetical protein
MMSSIAKLFVHRAAQQVKPNFQATHQQRGNCSTSLVINQRKPRVTDERALRVI